MLSTPKLRLGSHLPSSHSSPLGRLGGVTPGLNNLDSPGPLLGRAELGCDSLPTHTAPHTSLDLTHCSLSPAGARLSPSHSLPPFSDWLGPPASVSPQLWSLISSEHLPLLSSEGSWVCTVGTGDCGTIGTCLFSFLGFAGQRLFFKSRDPVT